MPTTPPPRITSAPGISLAVVASRLVHGSASRRPSIGGSAERVPPARITALARLELDLADVDALLAREDAEAAVELDAPVLEPRQHRGVVEVVDDLVAALEHGLDVELARDRVGGAGDAADLAQDLLRAQQRLRGHAGVERALASDDVVLDQGDLEAGIGQPPRRHLTGGPAADDHHVEALHASPRLARLSAHYNGNVHSPWGRQASTRSVRGGGCEPRCWRPRKTPAKP